MIMTKIAQQLQVEMSISGDKRKRDLIKSLERKLKLAWAKKRGLKQMQTTNPLKKFLGLKNDYAENYGDTNGIASWLDHTSFWERDGVPAVIVGQPYQLHDDSLKEMMAFAKTYDLKVSVRTSPSWHYPGSVLFVELWKKD